MEVVVVQVIRVNIVNLCKGRSVSVSLMFCKCSGLRSRGWRFWIKARRGKESGEGCRCC